MKALRMRGRMEVIVKGYTKEGERWFCLQIKVKANLFKKLNTRQLS